MWILGIDPGLKGGYAVVNEEGLSTYGMTPCFAHARKGKTKAGKPDYDRSEMLSVLRALKDSHPGMVAVIEAVSTRPGQNAAATLQTGIGFGLWEMALVAWHIPRHVVFPQVWKRHAGLLKQPKNAVRVLCQQRWPTMDWRKVGDGPMDAAVMADIWRKHLAAMPVVA